MLNVHFVNDGPLNKIDEICFRPRLPFDFLIATMVIVNQDRGVAMQMLPSSTLPLKQLRSWLLIWDKMVANTSIGDVTVGCNTPALLLHSLCEIWLVKLDHTDISYRYNIHLVLLLLQQVKVALLQQLAVSRAAKSPTCWEGNTSNRSQLTELCTNKFATIASPATVNNTIRLIVVCIFWIYSDWVCSNSSVLYASRTL